MTRPATARGRVERIVPSVRRQSGEVNTSSVGRLATCGWPHAVVKLPADIQRALGRRPTVRSVPGPR